MIFKCDPAALFDFKALIKLVKPPLTICRHTYHLGTGLIPFDGCDLYKSKSPVHAYVFFNKFV